MLFCYANFIIISAMNCHGTWGDVLCANGEVNMKENIYMTMDNEGEWGAGTVT